MRIVIVAEKIGLPKMGIFQKTRGRWLPGSRKRDNPPNIVRGLNSCAYVSCAYFGFAYFIQN
jgi:hypothetical protein